MKKFLLLTMLILGLSVQAWAYDFVEGGIYYNINDDGTVEVTYGGSSASAGTDTYTGDIVVPSTVTHEGVTYAVTSIGASAFRSNSELLSVYLPSSITYVAERAFQASSVITITFEENANLVSFGGTYTFYGCEALESITLPSNMPTIVNQMFRGCKSLEKLEIPETVTSIEDRAFYDTGLKSIVIPDNVITIGTASTGSNGGVLRNCTSLEEAVIGDAVTTVEYQMFYGDTSLKKVTFGKSCEKIGSACFNSCTALEEIIMKCPVPPTAAYNSTSPDATFFKDVPETCVLYVPEGCKEAYEAADVWSTLTIVEVTEGAEDNSYKFVCTDWGSIDTGRVTDANVTYDTASNTITVNAGTGANNVALSNGREAPYTTASYIVTNEQHWFIVVGTNLSTAENASKLWWMNGENNGEIDPTTVETLSDGQVLVAWDLTTTPIDGGLMAAENLLDGWTGFGLTSTTGTSVISDICFYTLEEAIEAYPELSGELHDATPYEFVCTDWGSIDTGRVTDANVTYDTEANTITVNAGTGANNVALSNGREAPFTTANMTVTNLQCWYTVVGTNLSTASGDSKLWWMNGANWGEWDPTEVVELGDGQVLVTWDLSTMTEIDVNLQNDENNLNGWTGFGLTSTTGTSIISDINFYTEEELQEIIDSNTEPGIEEPENPYIYDVTYALNNPSFELDDIEALEYDETRGAYVVESPEGWTLTGEPGVSDIMTADATATDNNFGVPGEPSDGAQMLYLRNSWVDNKAVALLQGVTLPAGDYKLTVDTKCVSTTSSTATLVAGDESVALTIHGTENGSEATKENPFLDAWDTAVLTFTLTAETTLDLGVDIVFNGGNGSFLLDNFQLWSAEEVVITVDGNDNDYAVGDEVEIDGVTYAVVSDNMFVNGGFGDDVNDWTGSDYVTAADPDDFTLNATGGYNDGEYLTIASSSTGGGQGPGTTTTVNNLTQSIQIESGKTYLFVGYTTGGTTTGGGGPNQSTTTSGLNQMSNATTEVTQSSGGQGPGGQTTTAVAYVTLEWGSTTPGQQSTGWTQTLAVFTAETPYAGMHLARSGSYDGFQLYEVEEVVEINDNEYAAGDVAEIDGIEYAVVSDNMVVNGGFDDGVDGWKANLYTDDAVLDNFTYATEGGFNDGAYITIKSGAGAVSTSNLSQAIPVEEGKTYLFIGYTSGTAPSDGNMRYNGVMQMSDATTEVLEEGKDPETSHDAIVEVQMEWNNPDADINDWTKTIGVFTASTPYVGVRFSWCGDASFDGIQLYEVESAEVEPEPTPGEPVDWLAHSEEAVFEHWTTTGNNGTFQYNDWSTESDASGMVTPFIENWIHDNNDTPLTAATISHNTLVGLPAGDYTVSLDIRILNELEENVTTGTTFNANGVSVDLVEAGTSGTYGDYDPEVYGTYTVECEVGDDGLLDISIEIPSNATYNWIAFKNLDVTIHADSTPVVTAFEGLMAADAREAMEAAIAAYNANPSESLFTAAIDAIQDASQAIEDYAEIMALVEALDEAGRAVWDETPSGIAYNNGTLSANADYTADMATAQKAQTTEGSDMTYVVLYEGTWIGQTGTYKTDYIERYDDDAAFTASDGKILYKQIDGLQPGTYTVTFLAVANSAWIGSAYGSNIAQVFVNEALEDVLVYNQVECIPTEYPHTMTGTVGSDGTLEFGLQNIGTGGNWYVAQAVSMTLGGEATPSVSKGDYEFINEDWVSLDLGRVSESDISYNIADNTITVNAGTGKNNVALGNSLSYSADGTITTADYTVGSSQNWFIVVGTDLSYADGDSYLWWMNGFNDASSVAPTYLGMMEDGQVLFAWDLTESTMGTNLQESLNYLNGWTGFGLTSTSGTSVISDISFYTWDDAVAKYPDLTDIATGIKSVGVDVEAEGIYTLSGMRLSKITKSGIYIIDGKKVLVK